MKTELYLQIPKPCHENWDAMTPVDKGKFCSSCSKEVVDFSLMTDVEVLNFFKKSSGNTCGRFNNDQLERPLQETKIEKKKGWKWAMASIASLIMVGRINAQKKENCRELMGDVVVRPKNIIIQKIDTVLNLRYANSEPVLSKIKSGQIVQVGGVSFVFNVTLKGHVVDENNDPIAGAEVQADNTAHAFTNAQGYFEVTAQTRGFKLPVTVKSFGFNDESSIIDFAKGKEDIKIIMKAKVQELPGVTVVSYPPIRCRMMLGDVTICSKVSKKDTVASLIRKTLDSVKIMKNAFKIYPNPAVKNSLINLSIKEVGNYQVQLFDNVSRLLHTEEHITTGKQDVINVQLTANISSGNYYIRLINIQTKKSYTDKLIVQ